MRKVFLDELPRKKGIGANKNKLVIDWNNCMGYKVVFIYDNIKGVIEIINYDKSNQKLYVKYNDNISSIKTNSFRKGQLGEILGIKTKEYKYNIGDIIKTATGRIQILEQIRIKNKKGYKYKCLTDGNIDKILESNLIRNNGCNVCAGKKVLKGYNDIWTTHPYVAKLLKYPNIGYKLSYGSTKSEIFVCPNCGYEKSYKIYVISTFGFSCPKCGDGFSYPNKFMFNLLEQLKIDFTTEYSPNWIKPKKFDFYFKFNDKKYIIEMDGRLGHGYGNTLLRKTPEETKKNDEYKDFMAEKHNIKVIRINCTESNLEYIKNQILNSHLKYILNLSIIDWEKCHKFACSSRLKEACELWNQGIKNAKQISKIMKISHSTVVRYLNDGAMCNLCDYNPDNIMKEIYKTNKIRNKIYHSKPIVQLTHNNIFIKKWENSREVYNKLGIQYKNISAVCRKLRKTAGGYKWMYYEDYIAQQNNQKAVNG